VLVLLAACGGKKDAKGATDFVGATLAVDEPAVRLFLALERLGIAEKTGRRGLASIEEFAAVMIEVRALSEGLAKQPRVSPGGDLAACADGWYAASDAVAEALAPVVAELAKGSSGKGHEFEDLGRVQIAWMENQTTATQRLCELHRAGATCSTALERYDFESVHRYTVADRVCR
jgi:hypothetical protein